MDVRLPSAGGKVWLHHRPIGLERCGAEPTERGRVDKQKVVGKLNVGKPQ